MTVYVVDADTVRIAHAESSGVQPFPTPAGASTDLAFWLNSDVTWILNRSTVVFPACPVSRTQLVDAIRALGWDTEPTDGAWFTCRKRMPDKTVRVRHLCYLDWVSADDPMLSPMMPRAGWNWAAAATNLAQVLVAWERIMGSPYRHTPGVSAHDSIRAQHRPHQPNWKPYRTRGVLEREQPPAAAAVRPMLWKNPTTNLDGCKVAKFDQRQAYLAALLAVRLPVEGLKHTGMEPVGPGKMRVRPTNPDHQLWTLAGRFDREGCMWLGSETARLFQETGPDAAWWELIDSWTAPGGRLLRTWAQRLDKLPVPVRKATYTQAVGMFNTKTGSIQRPDWYDLVIDHANATMLRRIWQTWTLLNSWPVEVQVDALAYVADSDTQLNHLCDVVKVGDGCGYMKLEDWSWR